ncbi:MAG TPA: PD-(D/E)XK nuclease family protein [Gaiellaceae bacterium]|nr:PD-(D/E)XK nuclease family protein [Gaiellaceae bacterium]
MRREQPASALVERLSPTSFEILHECKLRFAFGQQPSRHAFGGTPATRLGTVCHNVLDEAVRTGILQLEDWRSRIEQLWDSQLAEFTRRERLSDDPARWPGYQLKRARLFHVAGRIRELLEALPADTELLTEQPLAAEGGRLYGRPDLIIRSTERHQIIDYKSGGVMDRETNQPRDAYARQLQLYAFLEHDASGTWPTSAHLFPLQGAPVEIDIEAERCSEVAAQALDELAAYNAVVPLTPEANPTPAHCRWCPHATVCGPFWEACDESWAPTVLAAAGRVTRVFQTPLGGVTVYFDVDSGSVKEEGLLIKNIDPALHEDTLRAVEGGEVAATGLVADDRGSGYWLGSAGTFAASATTEADGAAQFGQVRNGD